MRFLKIGFVIFCGLCSLHLIACGTQEHSDDLKNVEDLNRLVIRDDGECAGVSRSSEKKVVYFEGDKKDLGTAQQRILRDFQKILVTQPNPKIVVEGYADARGSSNQNLVLSEERANSVRDFLVTLGLAREKIEVKFYGNEKMSPPFFGESQEEFWRRNRKAEVSYQLSSSPGIGSSAKVSSSEESDSKKSFNMNQILGEIKSKLPSVSLGVSKGFMTGALGKYISPSMTPFIELYSFSETGPSKSKDPLRLSPYLRVSSFSATGENSISKKSLAGTVFSFGVLADPIYSKAFHLYAVAGAQWFNWQASSTSKSTGLKDKTSALSLGATFGGKFLYQVPSTSLNFGIHLIEQVPNLFQNYMDNSYLETGFSIGYEL